mgnify:CR=1 FL=1
MPSSERKESTCDAAQTRELRTDFERPFYVDDVHKEKSNNTTSNSDSLSHLSQSHLFRKLVGTCKKTAKTTQEDFIREMRLLSRLRHPCITTVMGAVKMVNECHDGHGVHAFWIFVRRFAKRELDSRGTRLDQYAHGSG